MAFEVKFCWVATCRVCNGWTMLSAIGDTDARRLDGLLDASDMCALDRVELMTTERYHATDLNPCGCIGENEKEQ